MDTPIAYRDILNVQISSDNVDPLEKPCLRLQLVNDCVLMIQVCMR